MTDASVGQHGVMLYFRFPQGWAVVGEDDQFLFAFSDHFQSLYPSTYFPLFITSWSLELIDSTDFFVFFAATIFLP